MKKWDRLDLIYIVIIIVFAVVIQLFFISPPIMSDDMEYYFCATKFPHMPNPPSHWSLRIGLILPVAILYRIFGHAEIVYYTIPFISIVLLSCGTYWLGSRLFNQRLGVISALWLVTTPNLLTESSLLLPDIPATACITIGFGMLASLAKETPNKISKSTKNQKAIWYFLTGMCFGWGYLIKEYYILFIPIILCFFILFELSWKQAIQLFMGMVAVFGFESILNLILYDNPFVRLMTAEPRETQGFIERDVWTVISYFPTLIKGHGGWSHLLLCTIGFVTMLTGFFRKNKKFTFLASWFLLLYIFFTIVGLLPIMFSWKGETLLRLHKFRYWILVLPPLFIVGVAGLEKIISWLLINTGMFRRNGQISISITLGFLFIFSTIIAIQGVYNFPNLIRNGADHYLELRRFLKQNSGTEDLIWINRDSKISFDRILPMYCNDFLGKPIWHGRIKYLNTEGQYLHEDELTEGWVLINRYFFKTEFQSIPDYLENPPKDWVLIFESENKEIAIYEVG